MQFYLNCNVVGFRRVKRRSGKKGTILIIRDASLTETDKAKLKALAKWDDEKPASSITPDWKKADGSPLKVILGHEPREFDPDASDEPAAAPATRTIFRTR